MFILYLVEYEAVELSIYFFLCFSKGKFGRIPYCDEARPVNLSTKQGMEMANSLSASKQEEH